MDGFTPEYLVNSLPINTPLSEGNKTILDILQTTFHNDTYYSTWLVLMVLGGLVAFSRQMFGWIRAQIKQCMIIEIELNSGDCAHQWLLDWIGTNYEAQKSRQKAKKNLSLLQVCSESLGSNASFAFMEKYKPFETGKEAASPVQIYTRGLALETRFDGSSDELSPAAEREQAKSLFNMVPGNGVHWLCYRNAWIRLHRQRDEGKIQMDDTMKPFETIKLTSLSFNEKLIQEMLVDARVLNLSKRNGKTNIYVWQTSYWTSFGNARKMRDLNSVVLPSEIKDTVVKDVQSFLSRKTWYTQRGIPYRRGYLLHGAPGSGKTSFIKALAGHLRHSICLMNLAERHITDASLLRAINNLPSQSIVVFEDVDAAFCGRDGSDDLLKPSVTFSGLLNALDGVASAEPCIIFMTTNHLERLDPALVRPGRIDRIFELGDAKAEQVKELFIRFYYEDMLDKRLEEARIATGINPNISTEDCQNNLVGTEAPYRNAINVTLDVCNHLSGAMIMLVAEATRLRRQAMNLDPDGFPWNENPQHKPENVLRRAAIGGVSMAELQGLLVRFAEDPFLAIQTFAKENKLELHGVTECDKLLA